MKLTHVRLLVDDFEEAFRFYQQTVGLACTFGDMAGPYADFDTGRATLAILTRDAQEATTDLRERGDGVLLPLQVVDVDAEAKRLGLPEPVSRPDWGMRVTYLRDPAGNLLELYGSIPMGE